MFCEGYIGVTNNTERRWRDHEVGNSNSKHLQNAIKKYGWKNLITQVLVLAEEDYCFQVEKQLRAENNMGWNIVRGGGNPPNQKGVKRSQATIDRIKEARNNPISKKHMQTTHPLKKPCKINGKIYISVAEASRELNICRRTIFRWLTNTNCKRYGKFSFITECDWV